MVLNRFKDISLSGALADLMWSDPSDDVHGFQNSPRGTGYLFGKDVCDQFMHVNGFFHIYRAHQLCKDGYQSFFDNKLTTVWSAPNYMYRCKNAASLCELLNSTERSFVCFWEKHKEERIVKGEKKAENSKKDKYFL